MSPGHVVRTWLPDCFPRVSGDEPVAKRDRKRRPQFSPRERG